MLFCAHGLINDAIGAAAIQITDGADVDGVLHMMSIAIERALEDAKLKIEKIENGG